MFWIWIHWQLDASCESPASIYNVTGDEERTGWFYDNWFLPKLGTYDNKDALIINSGWKRYCSHMDFLRTIRGNYMVQPFPNHWVKVTNNAYFI